MSKLDYFTIGVVAVCVVAIIFLVYKTSDLLKNDQDQSTRDLQNTLREMGIEDLPADEETFEPKAERPDRTESEKKVEKPVEVKPKAANQAQAGKEKPGKTINEEPGIAPGKPSAQEPSVPGPGKDNTNVSPVREVEKAGDFMVVAGSFKYRENAEKEAKRLRSLGFKNASVEVFNNGTYATLIVDRFDNTTSAQQLVTKLDAAGVQSYVHKRREGE